MGHAIRWRAEGAKAATDGVLRDACPYRPGPAATNWLRGYDIEAERMEQWLEVIEGHARRDSTSNTGGDV